VRLSVVPLAELGPQRREPIVALCSAALGTDCSTLFGFLFDAVHVLAHEDGRLIGHACWTQRWLTVPTGERLRTAWVDAVVVAPELQGRGIGSQVMSRVNAEIAGFDIGGLGTERIAFYERLGWERWLGETDQVLHDPLDTLMILRTSTTPGLDIRARITAAAGSAIA
jgi:GNAT superfamily N-acetyltransferase